MDELWGLTMQVNSGDKFKGTLGMNPEDKLLLKWPNYLYSLFPTAKTVSERALLLPSGIGSKDTSTPKGIRLLRSQ